MICETCANEHDGSCGSGRFCSRSCSAKFGLSRVKNFDFYKKNYSEKSLTDLKRGQENGTKKAISLKTTEELSKPFEKRSFNRRYAFLLEKQNKLCLECGQNEWMNKPLKLQYDHIDGNNYNNLESNSRLLCPNCHSQTDTYCKGSGKDIVYKTDEEFIVALKQSKNIRQTLITLGLTAKGYNYNRCYKLMSENNIKFKEK